jgi:hypothetical protein
VRTGAGRLPTPLFIRLDKTKARSVATGRGASSNSIGDTRPEPADRFRGLDLEAEIVPPNRRLKRRPNSGSGSGEPNHETGLNHCLEEALFCIRKNLVGFVALTETCREVTCRPEIRNGCLGVFQDLLIFGQLIRLPLEACKALDAQSATDKLCGSRRIAASVARRADFGRCCSKRNCAARVHTPLFPGSLAKPKLRKKSQLT